MKTESLPCIVGIDFGTTSLSAVIIDIQNARIKKVLNYETNAYLPFPDEKKKEQSVPVLSDLFFKLLSEIKATPDINILCYGFTGQMHGIIGLDKHNHAVTNLITWQDRQGDEVFPDGTSVLDCIRKETGDDSLSNGYGVVSLYKLKRFDRRDDVSGFCTVPDYFARLLAQSSQSFMDPTMAHSMGLFDIGSNDWNRDAIKKAGLQELAFPEIISGMTVIGYTDDGQIPVVCGIGDNQASFLGSVRSKDESILLNVGTGAQLSFLVSKKELGVYAKYIDGYVTQLRPFDSDHYLVATSFINGGSAYKALFRFFREVGVQLFHIENIDDASLWENMEKTARACLNNNPLRVHPLLEAERGDTSAKGGICNLTLPVFHPGNLVCGFLEGLCAHYKTKYFPELESRVRYICGSGNGMKKNKLFAEMVESSFGKPLYLTAYNEEAAVGAAINAGIASKSIKDFRQSASLLSALR